MSPCSALLHCLSPLLLLWVFEQAKARNEPQNQTYSNDFHRAGKTDQSTQGGGWRLGPITEKESKKSKISQVLIGWFPLHLRSVFSSEAWRRVFLLESWNMEGIRFPSGMCLCVWLYAGLSDLKHKRKNSWIVFYLCFCRAYIFHELDSMCCSEHLVSLFPTCHMLPFISAL